jgi:hypothetical protein
MNIFVLHNNPVISAKMQHDKHVVKMILESAQMLCSAFKKSDNAPYKKAYYNHPCTKWTRQSFENFFWLIKHAKSLSKEYSKRFGRVHASDKVISWCWENVSKLKFEQEGRTDFAQAMPVEYKNKDSVQAYIDYYIGEKLGNNPKWTNSEIPKIFKPYIN